MHFEIWRVKQYQRAREKYTASSVLRLHKAPQTYYRAGECGKRYISNSWIGVLGYHHMTNCQPTVPVATWQMIDKMLLIPPCPRNLPYSLPAGSFLLVQLPRPVMSSSQRCIRCQHVLYCCEALLHVCLSQAVCFILVQVGAC